MKLLLVAGNRILLSKKIKDAVVFLITDDKRVYHVDSSDGNMWTARKDLKNLGKDHRKIVKDNL